MKEVVERLGASLFERRASVGITGVATSALRCPTLSLDRIEAARLGQICLLSIPIVLSCGTAALQRELQDIHKAVDGIARVSLIVLVHGFLDTVAGNVRDLQIE